MERGIKLIFTTIIFFCMLFCGCHKNSIESETEPLVLSLIPTHVTTNGGSNGAINLTVTGGIKPYKYLWSNGATTEDIQNLIAGIYTVSVTDADLELVTDSIMIIQPGNNTTVTDIDGNVYQTIKIGNQYWMAENLKTTHKTDGSLLSGVYAYNDDENNVNEWGRLYTWESANNASPQGWHLPTNAEWNELQSTLGINAADKLKEGGSSGFDAKMAGRVLQGSYEHQGSLCVFWTSTESGDGVHAMRKLIPLNESNIITDNELMNCGQSVRCVKD